MRFNFLPLFRRHLLAWFEARLADGRTPFRRVEERPPLLTEGGALPDLVLWINRDSLLAGALILIPEKTDPELLRQGAITAAALGLSQFVTWEAQTVNLWQVTGEGSTLRNSWELPPARQLTATDFTVAGDLLLQELKLSAITGRCPAPQLPATHFVSLCLLNLQAMQPALDEAARVSAGNHQQDALISNRARDKGWLTLWRLLALAWYQRLPAGVAPGRLEQALKYAVTDLPAPQPTWLTITADEAPLSGAAATRCQHLAGRLAQLGWAEDRQRARDAVALLLAEAARRYQLAGSEGQPPAADLLVNRLPAAAQTGAAVIAPRPCLAGWVLMTMLDGSPLPETLADEVTRLPQGWHPQGVRAWLGDAQLPAAESRRQRLTALRRAWPYRRFTLPTATPAWVWDALFLAGITAPEGELRLTLPSGWAATPGAELFWQLLGEQWALAGLQLEEGGRQTLHLVPIDQAPQRVIVQTADGERLPLELPTTEVPLARLSGLGAPAPRREAAKLPGRRTRSALEQEITASIFRDGQPRFPEDYLRRRDAVPLRHYQLPGPLRYDSSFFGHCRLLGPEGESIEVESPVTAEGLVMAAHTGRREVSLPCEPLLTAELLVDYHHDLHRLWEELLRACRRQLTRQQEARTLARHIWQRQQLPPVESER